MTPEDFLYSGILPATEARMLLQAATGLSRVQLLTGGREPLDDVQRARLDGLAARRLNGEPMAYILGGREFYGRLFCVNPATLIPRPETEHLVDAALSLLPQGGRVWDAGTGSGAIAVTLACERPDAFVAASDISPAALDIARANAQSHHARVAFACGSWLDADVPGKEGGWDLIVSNPPYIAAGDPHLQQGDLRFEPQQALTDFADGLSCLRVLAKSAARYLKAGGCLLLEHGFDQGGAVRRILEDEGWTGVETLRDLAGLERVALGRKPTP
ncbi:MAG: peptide chain release factor N(5)-glutamine methyltransferase [Neisseria sp.]|nr:peptide chain release factor N(5)-glutamine methyltransferase [Neisseria sp.]